MNRKSDCMFNKTKKKVKEVTTKVEHEWENKAPVSAQLMVHKITKPFRR